MLISEHKKFIFIHVYKNAGTSITTSLRPHALPSWQRFANRVAKRVNIKKPYDAQPFGDHLTAPEIAKKIGKHKFKQYFSFAVVRNPWDWQVSLYKYMLKTKSHHQHKLAKSFKTFETYIDWRCSEDVNFQKDFIFTKDEEQLVDKVISFENINSEFDEVCQQIGIDAELPKLNISNTKPYKTFYNDRTRKLVEDTFEPDISLFNYSF